MKNQTNEEMMNDYFKNIKKTLAYQNFTEDEKRRWDIVTRWIKQRARGTYDHQMREISAAYFAFVEGVGGTKNIQNRKKGD